MSRSAPSAGASSASASSSSAAPSTTGSAARSVEGRRRVPAARKARCCSSRSSTTWASSRSSSTGNFAADSLASLFAMGGVHVSATHVRLVLPVRHLVLHVRDHELHRSTSTAGISPPADRYLDYLLFVLLLPRTWSRGPSCVRSRCSLSSRPLPSYDPGHAGARSLAHRDRASRRRSRSATPSRRASSVARSATRSATRRSSSPSPSTRMPCRSTAIFPVTRTWPSAARSCSATAYRTTSTRPTPPGASRTSGGAGTSRSARGYVTTSTSRSAVRAARAGRRTGTS